MSNMFGTLKYIPLIFTLAFMPVMIKAQTSENQKITPPNLENNNPDTLYTFRQEFPIDNSRVETSTQLTNLAGRVDSILKADTVTRLGILGFSSIDGPETLNVNLAKKRAEAMSLWLQKSTTVDPSIIHTSSNGEDWDWFLQLVKADPKIPAQDKVIEIITSKQTIPEKEKQLRALQGGATWKYMAKNIFPVMRVAEVSLLGFKPQPVVTPPADTIQIVEEIVEEVIPTTEPIQPEPEYWTRRLYVKTNAPAWLMLWMNIAVEIDLAPHWSAAIPIYYSGFNYFTSKLKFRTFSVVPEVRWWPREDNMGFFLNAHLGLNQFNYAKGGDWRYQTYHGHSPALGGGIGIGYRWFFCKNHRWSMEAALGAGVYHLDYSIFQNIPNGLIVGRKIRTFFGIDQAALSFAYSFGVQRKEVKK